MKEEIWNPIKDFEGLYEVSSFGNVKALERYIMNNGGRQHRAETILKPNIQKSGYKMVVLCKDGKIYPKLVHRIVAETFIPNPDNKPVVDHIDTDAGNNNVENLRWATQKENCLNPVSRVHNSLSKTGHKGYLKCHTEETKRKISEALKGRMLTEEHRRKLSEAKKRRKETINET